MNASNNTDAPPEPPEPDKDIAMPQEESNNLWPNPLLPSWLFYPRHKTRAGITTNKGLKRSKKRAKMVRASRRKNRRR